MNYTFSKATKTRARARVALIGPSGSGKTYTALSIAAGLAGKDGRVAVIDTEHGSASKYADTFAFDVLELATFSPLTYVDAMKAAAGYDVLVIDSLSHAWMGKDGALEQVDRAAKRDTRGNSFAAWRDITPMHNALVEALVGHPAHLIVTMRSKTEYVLDKDERTGKTVPRKVGTAPVQRDGLEYEFDVVADLNLDHDLIVSKTRCPALDGVVVNRAGAELAATLRAWLSDGAPAPTTNDVHAVAEAGRKIAATTTSGNGGRGTPPSDWPGGPRDAATPWTPETLPVHEHPAPNAADAPPDFSPDDVADRATPPPTDPAPPAEPSWSDDIAAMTDPLAVELAMPSIVQTTTGYHTSGALALAAIRLIELSQTSEDLARAAKVAGEYKGKFTAKDWARVGEAGKAARAMLAKVPA